MDVLCAFINVLNTLYNLGREGWNEPNIVFLIVICTIVIISCGVVVILIVVIFNILNVKSLFLLLQ